jgi:hypothetical protein
MQRRTACRVLVGLLLGAAGCRRSTSEEKPISIPVNRFPGGRERRKEAQEKKSTPEK